MAPGYAQEGTGGPLPETPESAPEPCAANQLRNGLRERATRPLPRLVRSEQVPLGVDTPALADGG